MTRTTPLVSARAETSRHARRIFAASFALAAMILPAGGFGMDSTPRQTVDQAGNLLPLPPIPYLDSMRWMSWTPNGPIFKIDTLLVPDGDHPCFFRIPAASDRALPKVG